MCGIFTLLNNGLSLNNINWIDNFLKGKNRGPDMSTTTSIYNDQVNLGFHRLSINGLDSESNQPLIIDEIILICNGEIYNYKELYDILNINGNSNSDCEIIIHLYKKYGIRHTLEMLDGVFAFVLIDTNKNNIHISRDPYGVRPLYYYKGPNTILFSSELKMMIEFVNIEFYELIQFKPGNYMTINVIDKQSSCEFIIEKFEPYFQYPFSFSTNNLMSNKLENKILSDINYYFKNAVKKRCLNSDREVCCLLSGGLDSSLVCALANQYVSNLKTFSIGLENSIDIIYARKVADFLKTDHHEIILTENEFFYSIPEVIMNIESYDTTTVRASVGNYLVSKYIKENTDCKVVLNGDGADELFGGYLYFSNCNDPLEFDKECKRLLKDICYFDVLRSDKCISSNGLEPRTPFLDKTFVQNYLSISPLIRCHGYNKQSEKYLIRKAFENDNILPLEILWRRKEAFSDGVSGYNKSWADIIQHKLETLNEETIDDCISMMDKINYNVPKTKEQQFYRYIFEKNFPFCFKTIPYFWMPKYCNTSDSSARSLSIYNNLPNSYIDSDNDEDNDNNHEIRKDEEPWDQLCQIEEKIKKTQEKLYNSINDTLEKTTNIDSLQEDIKNIENLSKLFKSKGQK